MAFKSGTEWQGNKSGRPINSGHRQKLFNTLIEPHREALFKKAIDMALLEGNESMLRLFLERILPAKPADDTITVEMPEGISKVDTLTTSGEVILKSVAEGKMTPKEGGALMACLEGQRKLVETTELAHRISEIERTLSDRKRRSK